MPRARHDQRLNIGALRRGVCAFGVPLVQWSELEHPYILRVRDFQVDQHSCYLVTDLCDCDLLEFIKSAPQGRLSEAQAGRIMSQLCSALKCCHLHGVYHRDLKPENVLLDATEGVKLADFGTCLVRRIRRRRSVSVGADPLDSTSSTTSVSAHRFHSQYEEAGKGEVGSVVLDIDMASPRSMSPVVGSRSYMAPELINYSSPPSTPSPSCSCLHHHGHDPHQLPPFRSIFDPDVEEEPRDAGASDIDLAAADVYALGVTLFTMVAGNNPWRTASDTDAGFQRLEPGARVFRSYSSIFPAHMSLRLRDLLQAMLAYRSSDRPSLESILAHPWIQMYRRGAKSPAPAEAEGPTATTPGAGAYACTGFGIGTPLADRSSRSWGASQGQKRMRSASIAVISEAYSPTGGSPCARHGPAQLALATATRGHGRQRGEPPRKQRRTVTPAEPSS